MFFFEGPVRPRQGGRVSSTGLVVDHYVGMDKASMKAEALLSEGNRCDLRPHSLLEGLLRFINAKAGP